jgi:hypothetical protein
MASTHFCRAHAISQTNLNKAVYVSIQFKLRINLQCPFYGMKGKRALALLTRQLLWVPAPANILSSIPTYTIRNG